MFSGLMKSSFIIIKSPLNFYVKEFSVNLFNTTLRFACIQLPDCSPGFSADFIILFIVCKRYIYHVLTHLEFQIFLYDCPTFSTRPFVSWGRDHILYYYEASR